MVLKLCTRIELTDKLKTHMEKRASNKGNWRRGKKGRRFVALDENLVFVELFAICPMDLIMPFVCDTLKSDTVSCVCAQWVCSNSVTAQLLHRDHEYGYGKYVTVLVGFDGFVIDTLLPVVENQITSLKPASCNILVFDSYELHAGAAGSNFSKLLISFAIPSIPEFTKIAHQNLHGVKKKYLRYDRRGDVLKLLPA